MKLANHTHAKNEQVVVIPRTPEPIVFKVVPLQDRAPFDALVKKPEAPKIQRPGQPVFVDVKDKDYLKAIEGYVELWISYMFLTCVSAEGLEFETVHMDDPHTYKNFQKEMLDFGFLSGEIEAIVETLMQVNMLTDDHIKTARDEYFLNLRS